MTRVPYRVFATCGTAPLALLMLALAAGAVAEAETALSAYPARLQLDHPRDLQRLVVVQTRPDGVTIDVTLEATISIKPDDLARWDGAGTVVPVKDGEGTVHVAYAGAAVVVPLVVRNAAQDPAISFRNDVEPVLMRAGCNTGSCHGSAQGKNGFRLSLFGYDPARDFISLTREARGRRVNAALPDESLMLLKPTGAVDHDGGERFAGQGPLYHTVERWIREGAHDDAGEAAALLGIEILPVESVLEGPGARQQFVVMASYSDGTDRDVTDLSVLSSVDDAIVSIGEHGLATAGDPGEAYIMARFGSFAVISQVIAVPADRPVAQPPLAPNNYIDELVYAKHRKLRIVAAGPCTDQVFVRRVYLDILGVLPTVAEAEAFAADTSADKRAALIDVLLERPEFNDLWAMKWAEILRVRSSDTLDRKGMYRYNDWLRESIANNKPIDELARELLRAEGGNFTAPAANFYLVEREPTTMAENVAQVFMGIQIKCAQCHNHPFERWTMDDYYSFAAFFAQVGRKTSSDPRETIIFNSGSGEVRNKRDGQVMRPKFLGGEIPDITGRDRRAVLAEWLASEANPWFAKNIANRVWEHFFGQGIIDPPDDVRVSNPASNPQLLDELARRLTSYKYDFRKLIRDLCNSNTYQMSTHAPQASAGDTRNFTSAQVRRLPSEMLLDAVCRVTETRVKFTSLPLGARAVQVADGPSGNYFLEVFGRPSRKTACTCERGNNPTLAQALHLINGATLTQAIEAPDGRPARAIANEASTESIVNELYVAAYARESTPDELQRIAGFIDGAENRKAAVEDVYWTVLNSKEFMFNH